MVEKSACFQIRMMEPLRGTLPTTSNIRNEIARHENRRSLPPLDRRSQESYRSTPYSKGVHSSVTSNNINSINPSLSYPSDIAKLQSVKLPPLVNSSSNETHDVGSFSSNHSSERLKQTIVENTKTAILKDDTYSITEKPNKRKKKKRTYNSVPWNKISQIQDGERNSDVINENRFLSPRAANIPFINVTEPFHHHNVLNKDNQIFPFNSEINSKNGNVQLRYKESLPPIGSHLHSVDKVKSSGEETCNNSNHRQEQPVYEKGFCKDDLYSPQDLDFRPYTAKRNDWKDTRLEKYLQDNKTSRRNAICEVIDHERKTGLVQFCEDMAILNAIQQCF